MNKFIFIVLMMISFVSFTSCTNDDSEYIDVNKDLCISEWRKDISLNILPYNKIEDKCNDDIDITYINKNTNNHVLVTYTYEYTDNYMYMSARINDSIDVDNICKYIFNDDNTYSLDVDTYKLDYLLNIMYKVSLEDDFVIEEDNVGVLPGDNKGIECGFNYKEENDTCGIYFGFDDEFNHIGKLYVKKHDTLYIFYIINKVDINYSNNIIHISSKNSHLIYIIKHDYNNSKSESIYHYDYNNPQELDTYFRNHPYKLTIDINYSETNSIGNISLANDDNSYVSIKTGSTNIFNMYLNMDGIDKIK